MQNWGLRSYYKSYFFTEFLYKAYMFLLEMLIVPELITQCNPGDNHTSDFIGVFFPSLFSKLWKRKTNQMPIWSFFQMWKFSGSRTFIQGTRRWTKAGQILLTILICIVQLKWVRLPLKQKPSSMKYTCSKLKTEMEDQVKPKNVLWSTVGPPVGNFPDVSLLPDTFTDGLPVT